MVYNVTAVNAPLDLTKTDSDAASLTYKPSNFSLEASPIKVIEMMIYKDTKHIFEFALNFDHLYLLVIINKC